MEDIVKFLILIVIIFTFWICLLLIATNDLNKKIEELEKQSEEVHEYILNRIGG